MSTEKKLQHIVIVGGGFAGFLLAKRINPEKFRVTLVDKFSCLSSSVLSNSLVGT